MNKTLRVWDLGSSACLRTLEGYSGVNGGSVTPTGGVEKSDKMLLIWDLQSRILPAAYGADQLRESRYESPRKLFGTDSKGGVVIPFGQKPLI